MTYIFKYVLSFLSIKSSEDLLKKFQVPYAVYKDLVNNNQEKDFVPLHVYYAPVVHLAIMSISDSGKNYTVSKLIEQIHSIKNEYMKALNKKFDLDFLKILKTFCETNFLEALDKELEAKDYEDFILEVRTNWDAFKLNPTIQSLWLFIKLIHEKHLDFFGVRRAENIPFAENLDRQEYYFYLCFGGELEYLLIQAREEETKVKLTKQILYLKNVIEEKFKEKIDFSKNLKTKFSKGPLIENNQDHEQYQYDPIKDHETILRAIPLMEESFAIWGQKPTPSFFEFFIYPGNVESLNLRSKQLFSDGDKKQIQRGFINLDDKEKNSSKFLDKSYHYKVGEMMKFLSSGNSQFLHGLPGVDVKEEKEQIKKQLIGKKTVWFFLGLSSIILACFLIGYKINKFTSIFQGGFFKVLCNILIFCMPVFAIIFVFVRHCKVPAKNLSQDNFSTAAPVFPQTPDACYTSNNNR